jgi:microcystin-dependent protein
MAQVDRGGTSTTPPSPPPVFRWRGGWTTGREYIIYDVFRYEGESYIVNTSHTSGSFPSDLGSGLVELMAAKGASGSGSGDLLAANNLSDVDDVDTARSNLGAASTASLSSAVSALDSAKLNVSAKATTLQATTGTNDDNYMTPAKTAAVIATLPSPSSVPPGTVIMYGGTGVPTGYLEVPTSATNVSRTTYADLFNAIGITYGAGDGTTTFGLPFIPANYAPVQRAPGSQTTGDVKAHTHVQRAATGSTGALTPTTALNGLTAVNASLATASTGGPANLPAGMGFKFLIKF